MYHKHCENLRYLRKGIDVLKLDLNKSISQEDKIKINIYNKLLSSTVTSWAEVRVLKLVNEPNGFTELEKSFIEDKNISLEQKWKKLLKISVCKAYGINYLTPNNKLIRDNIVEANLSYEMKIKFNELKEIIDRDLVPSINIRNKIAHGQWKYPISNDFKTVNIELENEFYNENIIRFSYRINVFEKLSQIIHDLCVSKPTFERDFDRLFASIKSERGRNHIETYERHCRQKIKKYKKRKLSEKLK